MVLYTSFMPLCYLRKNGNGLFLFVKPCKVTEFVKGFRCRLLIVLHTSNREITLCPNAY